MLSAVWIFSVILSTVFILINGNISEYTPIISDAADGAISLVISLAGIMAIWGGIMEIMERSGLTETVSKLLSFLLNTIFPKLKKDRYCKNAISMNMTANILGLGNAATPLGLEAMKRLKAAGGNSDTATDEMVTFVIINTASIQLIPATTAVLRASYGSTSPMSILPSVLAASVCSLVVGLIVDRALRGKFNA